MGGDSNAKNPTLHILNCRVNRHSNINRNSLVLTVKRSLVIPSDIRLCHDKSRLPCYWRRRTWKYNGGNVYVYSVFVWFNKVLFESSRASIDRIDWRVDTVLITDASPGDIGLVPLFFMEMSGTENDLLCRVSLPIGRIGLSPNGNEGIWNRN